MKFANLVAVSSIQRIQTGGLLSLLFFFSCRGPYIYFWSLVRPGPRLTDFYCLILSRLLANMQLRLDTLSSSHNYFCGNTKIVLLFARRWIFFGLRASTLWEPESWHVLYHDGRLQDSFSKNISFDDFQKTGVIFHVRKTGVACRDLHCIRFWGSNPSCLCATHVAIKICCYFGRLDQVEDWIVLKDAISWEMTTDAFWYACLFAGKSFAMQLWQQKTFANLCTIFGPQNGGWKMGPKNGARI